MSHCTRGLLTIAWLGLLACSDDTPPGGAGGVGAGPGGQGGGGGADGASGPGGSGGAPAGGGGSGGEGGRPPGRCYDYQPLRKPLFGDLHVHTSYSMDAWVLQDDARHDPSEAFAFARGQPFELASGDVSATVGLVRPLDFAAVTDHSEFLGHTEICTVPGYDG